MMIDRSRKTTLLRLRRSLRLGCHVFCLATSILPVITPIRSSADQVEMQNGDRYLGKVLSLNTNTLVLQSEILGTVRLARDKIALISLQETGLTHVGHLAPAPANLSALAATSTQHVAGAVAPPRQLERNTNLIQQVQAQFLNAAGPEANQKFNEMVGGLLSGKLTLNDIRAEAQAAVNQLLELKNELGEDGDLALDGYLSILKNFLRHTVPPPGSAPTTPRPAPKTKPNPLEEDEN